MDLDSDGILAEDVKEGMTAPNVAASWQISALVLLGQSCLLATTRITLSLK